VVRAVVEEAIQHEKIERIKRQIDMAEAFQFGYVGARKGKGQVNQTAYSAWVKRKERLIAKLEKRNVQTIWGSLKRSRML